MMAYVLAAAVALGGFIGWRVTSWANDADYKAQVQQVASAYEQKRQASEALIRQQLSREQKTRIIYRTIKEAANEITIHDCFDTDALSLWNQATANANPAKAGKPAANLLPSADALKRQLTSRIAKSH